MAYACQTCGRSSRTRYCPEHGGKHQRPNAWQRGYTQEFQRNRTELLKHHPPCAHPDCTNPATIADHDPPRKVLIATGVTNPDSIQWLTPLCATHHHAKTRRGK